MTERHATSLHPLERRVLKTIRETDLVRPGERGLVSVSGGSDSMALLHVLAALAGRLKLHLEVLHFDHGLRQDSAQDASWVTTQAGALELPIHIIEASHLAALESGVQAAARAWRRHESLRLLSQWQASWIATGHQRDDDLETWLLKWLRGAHLSGLQGMGLRKGHFIRPLLQTGRDELRDYLKTKALPWLEDPSNREPRYKRNRVRNELIPLLNDLAGHALPERLADLEIQSRGLAAWVDATLEAHPVDNSPPGAPNPWISVSGLMGLPPFPRETALHRFITRHAPGLLPSRRIHEALSLLDSGNDDWRLDWPEGRRLRRFGDRLILDPPGSGTSMDEDSQPLAHTLIGGHEITHPPTWRVLEGGEGEGLRLRGLPEKAPLQLRTRLPGDRFHPPWTEHPVKLKDFLRDQHIPRMERNFIPLVVMARDGDSEKANDPTIIAVYPRHIAKPFAKDGQSGDQMGLLRLVIETDKA